MAIEFIYRGCRFVMELVDNAPIRYKNRCLYVNLDDVTSCINIHNADIRPDKGIMSIDEMRFRWEEHQNLLTIPTDSFEI